MNAFRTPLPGGGLAAVLMAATLLMAAVSPAWSQGFIGEQHQMLDELLGDNLAQFKEDADRRIDLVLGALADAYQGSPYANHEATESVRRGLTEEGAKLKRTIAELRQEITAARPRARQPATMILLLSKAQTMGFQVYRWERTAIELTHLALAASRRNDATSDEFLTKLMKNQEDRHEELGMAIQGIVVGVLAKP